MGSTTKLQEGEGRGRPPWWEEGERAFGARPSPLASLRAASRPRPTLGMTNLPTFLRLFSNSVTWREKSFTGNPFSLTFLRSKRAESLPCRILVFELRMRMTRLMESRVCTYRPRKNSLSLVRGPAVHRLSVIVTS